MKNRSFYIALLAGFMLFTYQLFGDTAAVQPITSSGLGVWNDVLYIHTADTLTMQGNLHLFQAEINGSGTLLMKDARPCYLLAEKSSLTNLLIDNTDTVTLIGELFIKASLTILHGVLDTRNAHLFLADTAQVKIEFGQWLKDKDFRHYEPLSSVPNPSLPQLELVARLYHSDFNLRKSIWLNLATQEQRWELTPAYTANWSRRPDPPPRE